MKKQLLGSTLAELQEIVSGLGMAKFTAKQIALWLYKSHVTSIDQMTNISESNRELLSERYQVGLMEYKSVLESGDGTKKYLFPTSKGEFIESAYIPDRERATLCVSSQVGCKMACEFCMTGRQGFQGNLSAGDIINQIESLPERDNLSNIVYMGMGEPLDNLDEVLRSIEIITAEWGYGWSSSRVTLSTIGVLGKIDHFIERCNAHLAISLHNAIAEERQKIVPMEHTNPIWEVVQSVRKHDLAGQRRVSFEYIVFKGVNDSPRHVDAIAKLLNGLRCRINLIVFHKIPGSPYFSPDYEEMVLFQNALLKKGFVTTIRRSRGEDIDAACGLLSTKKME